MRQTQKNESDEVRNLSTARRPKHKRDLSDRDERHEDENLTSVAGEEDPGSADEELREKEPGRDV